ncbi:response regulator transcription factor [Paenibacillus sp. FSL W8-1187]|uniref:response regulator transcription factor n=1 Tax=Paenibacillus sp. FSL W8-1187 TaxID=2975339 RepID=UPI0030D6E24B
MWTIAIVDDDRQALDGMSRLIPWDQLDASLVGEASDGEQGLRLIEEKNPDIVITDIYMPVMNGLDMIEELRKQEYGGKIIILSGYSDFDYARKALRLSVDDYLPKPASLPTIREVLGRVAAELSRQKAVESEEREIREKLLQYEPYWEREWAKSVLTGGVPSPSGAAAELPAKLGWSRAQVMTLAVELKRQGRMEGMSLRDWSLFRFAIGNMVEELAAAAGMRSLFLELHSHQMAILLSKPLSWPEPVFRQEALELAGRIVDAAGSCLHVKLRIGAGSRKSDWRLAADSTEEAFRALGSRRQPHPLHPCVYLHEEGSGSPGSSRELRPVRFFQEMADAIRSFDERRALLALEQFCREGGGAASSLDEAMLEEIGAQLFAILSFTLYESGIRLDDALAPSELSRELALVEGVSSWKDWVAEKIRLVCSRYAPNENLKHKETVDFIIQYIHEHYAENIHLQQLADRVYISKNHLSTIFRQATGETFGDYLTRVRMERAKSMVLEKRLLVAEIAEKVGYRNVPYFTTLFKRHTGKSPTEFYKA